MKYLIAILLFASLNAKAQPWKNYAKDFRHYGYIWADTLKQTYNLAYNATTWNGSLNVPTMDAIRDKIESLSFPNFFSADLTQSADRAHAANGHGVNIDSLTYLNFISKGRNSNKRQRTFISMAAGPTFPIWIGNIIRDTLDTQDSVNQAVTFQNDFVQISSQSLKGTNTGLSLIDVGNPTKTIRKGYIDLLADSIIARLPIKTSGIDTVIGVTEFNPSVGIKANNLYKIAVSDLSVGGGSTPNSYFQTSDATVATTTTETTLISSGTGTLVIPASNLIVGKTYRLTVRGKYSTSATNPANFNFRWYIGATQILGSVAGVGTNKTDETFDIHSDFICRSTGVSGSVMAQGMFFTQDGPGAHGYAATTSTINTTTSNTMNFTVEMNDSSAGNSVTIYILYIEEVNP